MDWDSDGRKDLVLGERYGYVRVYLNTNTDDDPVFSGYFYVQMGGADFDAGYTSSPYVADWNNDGKKDLLCGEDNGYVWLLINTGTDQNPVFRDAVHVKDGGADLDVGTRASPVVFDWNGDGRKDLLVGDTYGNTYFFDNRGTDAAPSFNGSVKLQAGGSPIDVGYYARFEMSDWDDDGTADIICGQYDTSSNPTGGVFFFHALGPLSVDENALSRSTGGMSRFMLKAGAANAGRPYFLLGSASGTSPGTVLPGGAVLPLNRDFVFDYILAHYNSAMLQDFRGTLDAAGEATALLRTGSAPLGVGTILNFAYTTESPYGFQSNPVPVEITP